MAIDAYEFDYDGKHYRWDRSTLRSPEGRAEMQRVLTTRVTELGYLGYTVGYQGLKDIETAKNVLQALRGNVTEPLLRAIETDIVEKMMNAPAQEETQVAAQPTEPAKPPDVDVERVREMNRIAADREGAEALRRAAAGQALDARQAAIVKQYKALEFAHNEQARHEQHSPGGWFKTTRPHALAPELYAIERIADPRERAHAIRRQQAAWRDDPKSPFSDTSHPDHKNAVEWMQRLYQADEELGAQPEDEK